MTSYGDVYIAAHGEAPWSCTTCGVPTNLIHHIDGDHDNDALSNLEPQCRACHAALHHTGRTRPPTTGPLIAAGVRRWWEGCDAETRQKTLDRLNEVRPGRGHTKHEKFGELQRNAQLTLRLRRCECGMVTNAGSMGRHTRASGHQIVGVA